MRTVVNCTPEELLRFKNQIPGGKVYKVEYFSKKDNRVVVRTAQNRVTKYLKGIGKNYSDQEKGLTTYFDCIKRNYRSPRVENLRSIKYSGILYKITQ